MEAAQLPDLGNSVFGNGTIHDLDRPGTLFQETLLAHWFTFYFQGGLGGLRGKVRRAINEL